jgi:hypothetical protein
MIPHSLFICVKQSERETDYSPPRSAEVKNVSSLTSSTRAKDHGRSADLKRFALRNSVCVLAVSISVVTGHRTIQYIGAVAFFVLEVHRKFLNADSVTDLHTAPLFTKKCVITYKQHTFCSRNYQVLPIYL